MAREADRLGLLLWEEIPVYWTIHWDDPATLDNAKDQLTSLVERDKNRASVIIWSVGNETPVSACRTAFLSQLIARARAISIPRVWFPRPWKCMRDPSDPNRKIVDDPFGRAHRHRELQ